MKDDIKRPATDKNTAKAVKPAVHVDDVVKSAYQSNKMLHVQGPTFHFAWKLATLAKHAIARKLKKIWPV
jgi:hypothetical protein